MKAQVMVMDAALLADFLRGGCEFLSRHKEEVNALNVFPVPDGDTGINMYLTINSAVKNIAGHEYASAAELGADFAMGALMGARGNSGVILSQIFRGFTQSLAGKKTLSAVDFAQALQKGVDLSYKSVMKPVEGTILTVFREFAAAAAKEAKPGSDIVFMLQQALAAGETALAATPDLLPVLKEAGVVDAGGRGLLFIMEGGCRALSGEKLDAPAVASVKPAAPEPAPATEQAATAIEYVFDIQMLIKGQHIPQDEIRGRLSHDPPGDCLLVVGTEEVVKIHFHSNLPWQVLEYAAQFGSLHDIVIENMSDQHEQFSAGEQASTPEPPPEALAEPCATAVIAVCAGEGLSQVFSSMGATVIAGGQTMNPSAEDILTAIAASNSEEVVLLPNNSNIILTAGQAQALAQKPTQVVPSKFVTQGVSAMLCYDKNLSAAENADAMAAAIKQGISLEVTYAVRNSKYNGFNIKPNDILGLKDGEIVTTGKKLQPTVLKLVEKALAEEHDYSLISFFYGHDLTVADAAALAAELEKRWPDFDIEYHEGGQPLYYLLMSIE